MVVEHEACNGSWVWFEWSHSYEKVCIHYCKRQLNGIFHDGLGRGVRYTPMACGGESVSVSVLTLLSNLRPPHSSSVAMVLWMFWYLERNREWHHCTSVHRRGALLRRGAFTVNSVDLICYCTHSSSKSRNESIQYCSLAPFCHW